MIELFYRNLGRWNGERINGVRLPANTDQLWSDTALAAIGLYRAKPYDTIPDGKQSGRDVEWDGFAVRYVLEDIPSESVPESVTAAQAKLALDHIEILDDVIAVVNTHPVRAVKIWFNDANEWERNHPYIAALGIELGLDDEMIDMLFKAAKAY